MFQFRTLITLTRHYHFFIFPLLSLLTRLCCLHFFSLSPTLYTFKEPRNRFHRIDSANVFDSIPGTTNRVIVPTHPGIDSLDSIPGILKVYKFRLCLPIFPPTAFLNSFLSFCLILPLVFCVFLLVCYSCVCKLFLFK
jgi:hypothetical protein